MLDNMTNSIVGTGSQTGLDGLLAKEIGYQQLIQWLAALDPEPLRRGLRLGKGVLSVRREVMAAGRARIDLVVDIDGTPQAVAEVKFGAGVHGDQKRAYDVWCDLHEVGADRRFVISLEGGKVPGWSMDPQWDVSVSIISLLKGWREKSQSAFVRELAEHALSLASEVSDQSRGLLSGIRYGVARRLVAKRLLATCIAQFPPESGVELPVNAASSSGGPNVSVYVPIADGLHLSIEIEPCGGSRAQPASDWGIRILAAAMDGDHLDSRQTEMLALDAMPLISLERLREHLDAHGLSAVSPRVYSSKNHLGTKLGYEQFDPDSANGWHSRFTRGQKPRKGTDHPLFYGYVNAGLGLQFFVANSVSVEQLERTTLVLVELILDTASHASLAAPDSH
jgi:hypothetical protein